MEKRLAILGLLALLWGCGGSDGVENPKLEMQFRPSDGAAAMPMRVSLYGKSANPVEDSLPLLSKDIAGGAKAEFSVEEMDAAIRIALARRGRADSGERDTTLDFNVVASAPDREAFVGGFSFRRAGQKVGFTRLEGTANGGYGGYSGVFALPRAVKGFSGRLGLYGVKLGIDYIFIPGSPYHASIDKDSSFTIGSMSAGNYGIIGADRDSSQLFASGDSLNTSDSDYSAKVWTTILVVPDH
jgi:hypothetical protein